MAPEPDSSSDAHPTDRDVLELLDQSWPEEEAEEEDPSASDHPVDSLASSDDLPDASLEPGADRPGAGWPDDAWMAPPPLPDEQCLGALCEPLDSLEHAAPREHAPGLLTGTRLLRALKVHRGARIGAVVAVGAALLGLGAQLAGREPPRPTAPPRPAPPRAADGDTARPARPNAGTKRRPQANRRQPRAPARPPDAPLARTRRPPQPATAPAPTARHRPSRRPGPSSFTSEFTP